MVSLWAPGSLLLCLVQPHAISSWGSHLLLLPSNVNIPFLFLFPVLTLCWYTLFRGTSLDFVIINTEWLWAVFYKFPHLQMLTGAAWAQCLRICQIMPFSWVVHWDCARSRLWRLTAWIWVWLLPIWPYTSYLAGLCLSLPIYEMGK